MQTKDLGVKFSTKLQIQSWPFMMQAGVTLIAGAIYSLGFSPFGIWPAALISVYWFYCLSTQPNARPMLLGWLYGLGFFGVGLSWVYASMRVVETPIILSVLMTFAFATGLAFLFAAQLWSFKYWKNKSWSSVSFIFCWLVFEWIRSWLLTGLPWLYLGYAMTDNWLIGWAPIVGSYGITFLALATVVLLAIDFISRPGLIFSRLIVVLIIWLTGLALQSKEWVDTESLTPIKVTALQGNIEQATKWDRDMVIPTYEMYLAMTKENQDSQLIVWPEAAITHLYNRAIPFLDELEALGDETNTAIVTGILTDYKTDKGYYQYWNSLIGLGTGEGVYHKTRLVPFGEYVPFEDFVRGLMSFFDLPMSTISPGPEVPELLTFTNLNQDYKIGSLICYEIAYPGLGINSARESNLLITVSNDAWFGGSHGPYQHLQIARMRAIESGRPVIRATQDGVSAIIDHKGKVLKSAPKFTKMAITADVQPTQQKTPYVSIGYVWLIVICLVWLTGVNVFDRFPLGKARQRT